VKGMPCAGYMPSTVSLAHHHALGIVPIRGFISSAACRGWDNNETLSFVSTNCRSVPSARDLDPGWRRLRSSVAIDCPSASVLNGRDTTMPSYARKKSMESMCAPREACAWLTAGAAGPALGTDADDLDDPSQSTHNVFAAQFPRLLNVALSNLSRQSNVTIMRRMKWRITCLYPCEI
jgi:hypothetical protein